MSNDLKCFPSTKPKSAKYITNRQKNDTAGGCFIEFHLNLKFPRPTESGQIQPKPIESDIKKPINLYQS